MRYRISLSVDDEYLNQIFDELSKRKLLQHFLRASIENFLKQEQGENILGFLLQSPANKKNATSDVKRSNTPPVKRLFVSQNSIDIPPLAVDKDRTNQVGFGDFSVSDLLG